MNWSKWIRQTHRWLSLVFTAAVIANLVAMAVQKQAVWVGLLALFPLILLMISGLYMFVLPYITKQPGGGATTTGKATTIRDGEALISG